MSVATATRQLGWLLRVSRRFSPDEAMHSGRTFARAFATGASQTLAPSQITRWETGELLPTRETIRRYEQLLGLVPESLVAVADTMMRYGADGASLRASQEADQDRDRLLRAAATASSSSRFQRARSVPLGKY